MKTDYLSKLRLLLDEYHMDDSEKVDIINDYNEMYDNWIDHGMSEDEVEEKLGSPKSIIGELVEGIKKVSRHNYEKKSRKSGKVIAVTPFIALVIFFVAGFGFDAWAYSWMAFLIIPVTAIISEMSLDKESHVLTALSPFVAGVAFFILGFVYNFWHPGWLVFLIIPVIAIFTEKKSIGFLNTLVSLSPFAALLAFFYFGELGLWNPGWLVFLIIPALGVLNEKKVWRIFAWESLLLIAVLGYLYIGYQLGEWGYAWLAFIPIIIFSIAQDGVEINGWRSMPKDYRIVSLIAIVSYIALGFLVDNMWGYAWLIFFIIPLYAINKEVKGSERIISFTPFIATIIFFTLGWFVPGAWGYAWLAFLIIPVVAIIKEG